MLNCTVVVASGDFFLTLLCSFYNGTSNLSLFKMNLGSNPDLSSFLNIVTGFTPSPSRRSLCSFTIYSEKCCHSTLGLIRFIAAAKILEQGSSLLRSKDLN